MKRKSMMTAVTAVVMAAAMSMTAFAAGWQQNADGWWYGTNADNSQCVTAGYKNAVTDLFRDAKGATTADKGAELLSKKGYYAVSDGINAIIDIEPYQLFWNVGNNSIQIVIMNSYK